MDKEINIAQRNRFILIESRRLGFSLPQIRKALLVLNGLKISRIALEAGIDAPNLSNTISGLRWNHQVQNIFAKALELTRAELFEDPITWR